MSTPSENGSSLRPREILIFVGIAIFFFGGIAVALLLPERQATATRDVATDACTDNLKRIGMAIHYYHDAWNSLPPAYTTDADGKPMHSWRTLILPFLDQTAVFDDIRFDEPWDSPHNSRWHHYAVAEFLCPNTPHGPGCSYSVVVGPGTMFPGDEPLPFFKISDGLSNTIMVVERAVPLDCWMDPTREITLEEVEAELGLGAKADVLGGLHGGNVLVLMGDGSIRSLPETATPASLNLPAAFTCDDGQVTLTVP